MQSHRVWALIAALLVPCFPWKSATAQQASADTVATDALLNQVRKTNVLTSVGAPPFHASLNITSSEPDDQVHTGDIDFLWADPTHYRVQIHTPNFQQTLIVRDQLVQESDEGDFYPTWLQNFVNAVLNPLSLSDTIQGHNDAHDNPLYSQFCIERDDRRNNVLDAAAYGRICFDKSRDMELRQTLDFTHSLIFSDFQPFHEKSVARSYNSSTRDGVDLMGTIRTLEDWKPDDHLLAISAATPTSARILTKMVTSSVADAMVQSVPDDVHWPTVRDGRLDGNILLHVVTDRTGRVREAAPYESDNEALRLYARDLVFRYQFKPLVVDGAPVQMEMPLVVHYKTNIGDAIPQVDDAWLRANVHCALPDTVKRPLSAGKQVDITLRINAAGKLVGIQGADRELASSLMGSRCKFPTVTQGDKPSEYLGHLKVKAR
jgi:hypothetical protein